MVIMQMDREKLIKMAGAVRTGGKGSMRRYCIKFRFTYSTSLRGYLAKLVMLQKV